MEEICHLILGHQPSRIDESGRSYHHQTEEEAYAIGAATLVPFKDLRDLLESGSSIKAIADRFDVSVQLVNYRIRVVGLANSAIRTRDTSL